MSHPQVAPSPDIVRLIREGYEVELKGAYLLVSHVPYVAGDRSIQFGTLVAELNLNGNVIGPPTNHVIHFIGQHPCHKDGSLITQIQNVTNSTRQLADGIVVEQSFSNKPPNGYPDYYQKMTRYIQMISAPARSLDPNVKAQTFRVIESTSEDSVFHYHDTNSVRAEIEAISNKLKRRQIGIVGLGGTGSYILDQLAKTPVDEIHLFDGDEFAQHNSFRSPGAPSVEQLTSPPLKVKYFAEIYSKMRREIHPHPVYLTAANVHLLRDLDFVFICVDKGSAKKDVVAYLEAKLITFIDVGMGVRIGDNNLLGVVRTTTSRPDDRDQLRKYVSFNDETDDEYATNIQIADLNMLNAALAVIKWKKLCGFYQDLGQEHHCAYSINVNQLS